PPNRDSGNSRIPQPCQALNRRVGPLGWHEQTTHLICVLLRSQAGPEADAMRNRLCRCPPRQSTLSCPVWPRPCTRLRANGESSDVHERWSTGEGVPVSLSRCTPLPRYQTDLLQLRELWLLRRLIRVDLLVIEFPRAARAVRTLPLAILHAEVPRAAEAAHRL